MKYLKYLFAASMLLLMSCKKDKVDGSSLRSFQSSVNDMASDLSTIRQIKFNEALYIIKTFGVEGNSDVEEMNAVAKLLDGKKTAEIFALADQIAREKNVDWSSSAPPSLGEMNIFGSTSATERDPNEIEANSLSLRIVPAAVDSVAGPQALQVIPRLLDKNGSEVAFSGATLETTMEVFSGGQKISTARNLMQNNNFKGFHLKLSSLPFDKIAGNAIDVKVSVRTTGKVFQMTKANINVNPKAPTPQPEQPTEPDAGTTLPDETTAPTEQPKPTTDPKATVSRFLNNLGSKNLRAAYDMSNNPAWGSFESFSNTSTGFGAVNNVAVKNVNTVSRAADAATVTADYTVTDNSGKASDLNVTYNLKASADGWKISGY
ncbi:MAG: hypothetical protein EAS48_10600, partial [Chryseobacterium sp.]